MFKMIVVDFRNSYFPLILFSVIIKLIAQSSRVKLSVKLLKKCQNMTTISMTYGFGSLYRYSIIIYTSSRIKETAISVPK